MHSEHFLQRVLHCTPRHSSLAPVACRAAECLPDLADRQAGIYRPTWVSINFHSKIGSPSISGILGPNFHLDKLGVGGQIDEATSGQGSLES